MVEVLSTYVWISNTETGQSFLRRREREKRENNRRDETNQGTLYAYMQIS
jgi:myo-inositol-1-phosphate synthase